jgi:ABC-type cobalamin/Fe3+-siderophores transport systems, ATPase components
MSVRLKVDNLTFSYDGDYDAVKNVSLEVAKGEFVGVLGPNGSGKSTVLKNIYRALVPQDGTVELDGENLLQMKFKAMARALAVVGQEHDIPFDFLVEEIIAMGRSPYKGMFDADTAEDKEMVIHALKHVGMADMTKRQYRSLSGGEKQRAVIARAIAQDTDFLLLDEPTNHLDINYQMQVFDFIKRLNVTVLSVMHDLNMASLYCDRIYILEAGQVALSGTPEEVLTKENIYNIYNVEADVMIHPSTGKPSITFLPGRSKVHD